MLIDPAEKVRTNLINAGTIRANPRFLCVCKKILIVEQDPLNRMLFADVLENEGFTIAAVTDDRETLAVVERFRPHLIIMDTHLPNQSGLELMHLLRSDAQSARVPILAVTGYVGPREQEAATAMGATAFMAKPISIKRLIAAVRNLLPKEDAPENLGADLGETPEAMPAAANKNLPKQAQVLPAKRGRKRPVSQMEMGFEPSADPAETPARPAGEASNDHSPVRMRSINSFTVGVKLFE